MASIMEEYNAEERRHELAIVLLCERIRRELVIPFCDRHRLQFIAGMGSWCFFRELDDQQVGPTYADYPFDNPTSQYRARRLYKALSLEYSQAQDVGSLVPSYTPKGWKGKP